MAMRNDFAIYEYVRPARMSAEGSIVLTRRLMSSAPDEMSREEQKALKRARDGAVEVQRIMQLRARRRPENMQAEDRALDGCWGAVHGQLAGWTRIPDHPNGQDAGVLLDLLFRGGLDFTNTKFEVQWVESNTRLELIEKQGLEERILRLIHPALLPLLWQAHEAFGEKLGVGKTAVEIPETTDLIEAIRGQSFLIADYARVMSASVDMSDQRSIDRFKKALAPLAAYRAENAPTRSTTDAEPDADTDVIDPAAPIPEPPVVATPVVDEPDPTDE